MSENFARRLKDAMRFKRIRVRTLSILTGFSEETIRSWLLSRRQPSWRSVQILHYALQMPYEAFSAPMEHTFNAENN